jgi:hypothetical protein
MSKFIPGMELAEGFYHDVVGPLLREHYPNLMYAAGLMGGGSDVLGFDTEASMDHDWGPRMQLVLPEGSSTLLENEIREFLRMNLPFEYRGFPTNFYSKPNEKRVKLMAHTTTHPVNHLIEISSLGEYAKRRIGVTALEPLTEREWLSITQVRFLEAAGGKVFHDEAGLNDLRARISWYPKEIWIFLMGCLWWRFRRWERSMGHSGFVGDDLGATVLAARVGRDIMRLAFMMEKTYAPYSKWFGSSFNRLSCAATLGPQLEDMMHSQTRQARDDAYARVGITLGTMHNDLGLTHYKEPRNKQASSRPFRIMFSDKFSRGLFAYVESSYLSGLFHRGITGNIDLITDNIDVALSASLGGKILDVFEPQDGEEVGRPDPGT